MPECALEILILPEREHRRLPATDNERAIGRPIEIRELGSFLQERDALRRVEKTHRDEVAGRPFEWIARIT